jgi:hypothetical protein
MKKPTIRDCAGCYNDFYNHSNMGANMTDKGPRCWSLETATIERSRFVPSYMQQQNYKNVPLTTKPSCYRKKGYSRIK